MKTVQKCFVFSILMMAGLIFAGCGDKAKDAGSGAGTTDASSTEGGSDAKKDDGSDAKKDDGSGDKGNASTATSGDFQLVSLNVPNMTWGGCAASVRGALASVDGIDKDSIETNTSDKTVCFKAKSGMDIKSTMGKLADNDHLKGWSLADN